MSRHHRGLSSWRLALLAAFVKERAGYRCEKCGRAGRLEADHIVPLDKGGAPFDVNNAQALCVRCHVAKTRAERQPDPDPERAAWRALLESDNPTR